MEFFLDDAGVKKSTHAFGLLFGLMKGPIPLNSQAVIKLLLNQPKFHALVSP
jgi:hypothetical protein